MTTIGQPSNNYSFDSQFSVGELIFESYERIGKSPAELTQTMLNSARRGLNLILQSMANQGLNLWAVDLQTVLLQQGVATINLPSTTACVLDVYVRQFQLTATLNETVNFSTTASSVNVKIYWPNNNLMVGQYVNVATPVAIGGVVVSGFFPVTSIVDTNNFEISLASPAVSTVNNGGVVPQFTSVENSSNFTVTLPANGQIQGTNYDVTVATTVGGVQLYGSYLITSITDANNFVIAAGQNANASQSVYMNSGQVQLQSSSTTSATTDRILTPMSRSDYASLPYKAQQGFPYSFWYDRLVTPTMTFWEVPDQNGPYVLYYYRLRQLQDANIGGGEIPDLQYRALEMVCARLAVKLALKYAMDRYEVLKKEAIEEFGNWEEEEREKTPLFIQPQMNRYYSDG